MPFLPNVRTVLQKRGRSGSLDRHLKLREETRRRIFTPKGGIFYAKIGNKGVRPLVLNYTPLTIGKVNYIREKYANIALAKICSYDTEAEEEHMAQILERFWKREQAYSDIYTGRDYRRYDNVYFNRNRKRLDYLDLANLARKG